MGTRYVVCESYPGYGQHIRQLAEGEEPIYHGYSGPSAHGLLCGRKLGHGEGWDTRIPLPGGVPRTLWSEPRGNFPCAKCHDEYLRRMP